MTEAESQEKAEALLRTRETSLVCSCGNGFTPRSIAKHVGSDRCPDPGCSRGRSVDGVRLHWVVILCHGISRCYVGPSYTPTTAISRSAHRESVWWPDGRRLWFWVEDTP